MDSHPLQLLVSFGMEVLLVVVVFVVFSLVLGVGVAVASFYRLLSAKGKRGVLFGSLKGHSLVD